MIPALYSAQISTPISLITVGASRRLDDETRWLYCVECPQYSTGLEAPDYLYASSDTVSPALRPTSVQGGILTHTANWPQ